jgi:hypothetical protein
MPPRPMEEKLPCGHPLGLWCFRSPDNDLPALGGRELAPELEVGYGRVCPKTDGSGSQPLTGGMGELIVAEAVGGKAIGQGDAPAVDCE